MTAIIAGDLRGRIWPWGNDASTAIGVRRPRVARAGVDIRREPPRGFAETGRHRLARHLLTAVALIKLPFVAHAFGVINDAIGAISAASRAGTSFVFGYLGGGSLPFDLKAPGADFILAFQALPIVLVMSVLTTLLFYWRMLPPVVRGMAWLLERTLGVGGAVGLSTAANIFLGMVEAPLFIRPYLAQLTRSELFLVMTGGMAGIAGTVLVLYATLLAPLIPDAAAHFVIASVLGAPAAILVSLIMVPETSDRRTGGALDDPDMQASSTMDAIVKGTTAGARTAAQHHRHADRAGGAGVSRQRHRSDCCPMSAAPAISLQRLLGYAMAPVCWLMGVPWPQAITAGSLMGTKTVLNELIAYVDFSKLGARRARSALAADHALCDVRLRQFRQPRHHDRRPRHHGAGAPPRDQCARIEIDRVGHADDLPDRRDRGRVELRPLVIPGHASSRGPGIHTPDWWLWIPGSMLRIAPE